ncbi:hypothetical protein Tco_1159742 [Tanacetum coccineum]
MGLCSNFLHTSLCISVLLSKKKGTPKLSARSGFGGFEFGFYWLVLVFVDQSFSLWEILRDIFGLRGSGKFDSDVERSLRLTRARTRGALLLPDHVFEDPEEDPEEESEEDEPDEMDMDMDMEEDSEDEMDGLELISPYEVMGSPNPPPPKSDTSSDSEPEDDTAATVRTIRQVPLTGRRFPGSTYVRGGSSSIAPIAYHPEDLVPSTMSEEY